MRLEGVIKKWNDEKGFGFVKPNSGPEIFVHIKSFQNQSRRPVIGDFVTFEIKVDSEGRPQAQRARFKVAKIVLAIPSFLSMVYFLVALGFLSITGYWAYSGEIPILIFALYLFFSLLTFSLYAIDKYAAQHGHWRTKESTLHLYSIAGGWPGALVAQTILRHKSKKQSFRLVFWFSVLVNCGYFTWLLSADGSFLLHQIHSSQLNTNINKYVSLLTVHKRL